jgi:hypothetical protein
MDKGWAWETRAIEEPFLPKGWFLWMLCPDIVRQCNRRMGLPYEDSEPIIAVGTGPPVEGLKEFSAPGIKLWKHGEIR